MTNPVDEDNDLENVDSANEVVSDEDTELSAEEDIPSDDETKPVKKKILALEARHKIEDYEIEKKIREALDYLSDGKAKKRYIDESMRVHQKSPSHHKSIPVSKKPEPKPSKLSVAASSAVNKPVMQKPESAVKTQSKLKPTIKSAPMADKLTVADKKASKTKGPTKKTPAQSKVKTKTNSSKKKNTPEKKAKTGKVIKINKTEKSGKTGKKSSLKKKAGKK